MHITRNKFRGILSRLACSMADLLSKIGLFSAFFRGDGHENSRRSVVCRVGIFHEDHSASTAIGTSNLCKWVINKPCCALWCHSVVHFEVKMSGF